MLQLVYWNHMLHALCLVFFFVEAGLWNDPGLLEPYGTSTVQRSEREQLESYRRKCHRNGEKRLSAALMHFSSAVTGGKDQDCSLVNNPSSHATAGAIPSNFLDLVRVCHNPYMMNLHLPNRELLSPCALSYLRLPTISPTSTSPHWWFV